ncbi:hypothetical protein MHC_04105 [Mycoplasma haemocanis str. Illinois]|uniref:Uncharacterized protein n=1 Tax=Mycoplasma haemocanis (strain Illinois) TaxID=1111676 RepID=H6N7Q5_MYCHN|nr:hypothetical protein [Mycoplasma haemocanis]AEW45677.1 hypothetical protein MHC_04105 [Mycoplasma haemocanis str. Illinois]
MAKLFPILAFSGLSVAGFGGWYSFSGLRPKNLKQYLEWQGFELAFNKGDNIWKSILNEYRDIVARRTGKDSPQEKDIQDWCSEHLLQKDYETFKDDASKLCVNNPRTVRAKIVQQSGDIKSLIEGSSDNKDKDYKVAYIFRKHISGFTKLIGFTPPSEKEGEEVIENIVGGGEALKKWCLKSLESKPDDSLISNVKTLCSPKGFKTILELIKKLGQEGLLLTDDSNTAQLIMKYNQIKDKSSWVQESKSSNESNYFDLKKWCEEHKEKNFYEEGVFSNVYPKFRFRCLKS